MMAAEHKKETEEALRIVDKAYQTQLDEFVLAEECIRIGQYEKPDFKSCISILLMAHCRQSGLAMRYARLMMPKASMYKVGMRFSVSLRGEKPSGSEKRLKHILKDKDFIGATVIK